jgi:hypothetical protein
MHDFLADYWWVSLVTVPALAIAIKLMAEKAELVDSLPAPLRRKLSTFDYSYPAHWVVTATLRDGRRFSRLVISNRFQLESQTVLPFKLRDLEDVAWEGVVGPPVGPVVRFSEGRPSAQGPSAAR